MVDNLDLMHELQQRANKQTVDKTVPELIDMVNKLIDSGCKVQVDEKMLTDTLKNSRVSLKFRGELRGGINWDGCYPDGWTLDYWWSGGEYTEYSYQNDFQFDTPVDILKSVYTTYEKIYDITFEPRPDDDDY